MDFNSGCELAHLLGHSLLLGLSFSLSFRENTYLEPVQKCSQPLLKSIIFYWNTKESERNMSNTKPKKGGGARRRPPAPTPEVREQQMIGLAMDLAERQLREGTASPSVIAHFLKLGSSREEIEQRHIEKKVEHLDAQIDSIQSSAHAEELYKNALDAMRLYSGNYVDEDLD